MNTYDNWKSTDHFEGTSDEHDGAACDCGSPLEGGENGLCTDCVREARDFAADCSDEDETTDVFSGRRIEKGDGWSVADERRYQAELDRIREAGGDID